MGVSIITPAFNGEKYISAAIKSVQAQRISDWEMIVVDDGSSDRTAAIAEQQAAEDPRIRVFRQENAGIAAARNRGYAETRPEFEYMLLLDNDDVLEPNALETLLDILKERPDLIGAHGQLRYIDAEGGPICINGQAVWPTRRRGIAGNRLVRWQPHSPTTFNVLAYAGFVPAGSILFRKRALRDIGLFDPLASPADDWDMWLRLSTLGDLAFTNQVIYGWRQHGGNTSRNRPVMSERVDYVRQKALAMPGLTGEQRRILRTGRRYSDLHISVERLRRARKHAAKGHWRDAMEDTWQASRHAFQFLGRTINDACAT